VLLEVPATCGVHWSFSFPVERGGRKLQSCRFQAFLSLHAACDYPHIVGPLLFAGSGSVNSLPVRRGRHIPSHRKPVLIRLPALKNSREVKATPFHRPDADL
jgi:hypothetical protein